MPTLMKGKVWAECKHKVQYPVFIQPKMDEIRCEIIVSGNEARFLSYAGKPLANMQPFAAGFVELAKATGFTRFDCGFEVNGNFNDSYRWVRSTNSTPIDLCSAKCLFYLFDLPEHGDSPFVGRLVPMHDVARTAAKLGVPLLEPVTLTAYDETEVHRVYSMFVAEGYEGAMVKQRLHLYLDGKRTDGWLKLKPEETADGKIVGFVEAVCGKDQPELGLKAGDRLGRIGSVILELEDGSLATPHGIAHELGKAMMHNPEKYLGQWVEFKYMERDRQDGYRHPTFKRLREDKL